MDAPEKTKYRTSIGFSNSTEYLQYFCLENSVDRGMWQATVHRISRVVHNYMSKTSPPLLSISSV